MFCLPFLKNLIQVEPASVVYQEVLHLNHRLVPYHIWDSLEVSAVLPDGWDKGVGCQLWPRINEAMTEEQALPWTARSCSSVVHRLLIFWTTFNMKTRISDSSDRLQQQTNNSNAWVSHPGAQLHLWRGALNELCPQMNSALKGAQALNKHDP